MNNLSLWKYAQIFFFYVWKIDLFWLLGQYNKRIKDFHLISGTFLIYNVFFSIVLWKFTAYIIYFLSLLFIKYILYSVVLLYFKFFNVINLWFVQNIF